MSDIRAEAVERALLARLRDTSITLSLAPLCAEAAITISRLRADRDAALARAEQAEAALDTLRTLIDATMAESFGRVR